MYKLEMAASFGLMMLGTFQILASMFPGANISVPMAMAFLFIGGSGLRTALLARRIDLLESQAKGAAKASIIPSK